MVEILFKDGKIKKLSSLFDFDIEREKILSIQLFEATEREISILSKQLNFIVQPLDKRSEIEISSRYVEIDSQIFLNLTIPTLGSNRTIQEGLAHIIILEDLMILNLKDVSKVSLNNIIKNRNIDLNKISSSLALTLFLLSALTDYYADLIELVSKKVKKYFEKIINLKNISVDELDNLTKIKLDNIQLRECLIELQRIILQIRRNPRIDEKSKKLLISESKDLSVINGHIKYNFDRLNDLKENISSKIELEQNHIIKIFTVVTVCIAPPTLIAGIYGMNFSYMPDLHWRYGYPVAVIIMTLSVLVTLSILKFKKWI